MAPPAWRGALPITYHIGPGPARVHLKLAFDWKLVPAYNVIAKLRGKELPDQWIVRGNHHDAWVNGASDPVSGMVAVMEEARAIGELAKSGWRPRRTIVFAGWDGEEPGLLGSTEWVEDHAAGARRRRRSPTSTPTATPAASSASADRTRSSGSSTRWRATSTDPKKGISVGDRRLATAMSRGRSPSARTLARDKRLFAIEALGSGSDYTPFLQHLGIASLNIGFGGEGDYGQYHSIYDSIDHYVRFMDPDFAYGVALAKVGGRAVLRLSEADLLPFEFERQSTRGAGLRRGHREARPTRCAARPSSTTAASTTACSRRSASPYRHGGRAEAKKDAVPAFDFAPLKQCGRRGCRWRRDASARRRPRRSPRGSPVPAATLAQANEVLFKAERALTRAGGPAAPALVQAPGLRARASTPATASRRCRRCARRSSSGRGTRRRRRFRWSRETLERYAAEVERAAGLLEAADRRATRASVVDRQHPVERDLRPLLRLGRHDDPVVDLALRAGSRESTAGDSATPGTSSSRGSRTGRA